jgi:hypothetical protein
MLDAFATDCALMAFGSTFEGMSEASGLGITDAGVVFGFFGASELSVFAESSFRNRASGESSSPIVFLVEDRHNKLGIIC